MAKNKQKPTLLDGLSTLRAAQRAETASTDFKTQPSRTALPGPANTKADAPKPASHIGHTVMPTKFEIECYACGYHFTISGKIRDSVCPKCKTTLEKADHIIDSEWSGTIKTIGAVEVKPGAVLKGGAITARQLILGDDAGSATLRICHQLELRDGGTFDATRASLVDVLVAEGSRASVAEMLVCRKLDVAGLLHARAKCEEKATIRAGGFLSGSVQSPSLVMEDGSGLKADLDIGKRSE